MMPEKLHPYLKWIFTSVCIAIAVYICIQVYQAFNASLESPTENYIQHKLAKEHESYQNLTFNLQDPAEAPPSIRQLVLKGYRIMVDTQHEAQGFAGDKLTCTNCHFAGGITTGGEHGGISLAGVAAKYPAYDERSQRVIDLQQRINNCFERSMNGKKLPLDSSEMLALVTYFHWISKDFPIYESVPWLRLKTIKSHLTADPSRGKHAYNLYCALCHRDDGQGGLNSPPLWGPESFNEGAGMSHLPTLAAFIHENMPYREPSLSEEDALDIASYILTQPRPAFR